MYDENYLHKIDSTEISVVIQGPLYRDHNGGDLAVACITSIRKFLPKAEIIISTWHHQNTNDLDVEKIIFSDEPQGFADTNGLTNNILKQMVSTKNGILAATRKYVLKFRADHTLLNNNIAVIRENPDNVEKLFQQPITLTNFFIRNPAQVPMLFHLSDLVQFGLREDMLDLWSIPLPSRKDVYFDRTPKFRMLGHFVGHTAQSQVPEQTLMLSWLKKRGIDIHLPHTCYTSYRLFRLWEQLLTDNFHMMNWNNAGILFPKRFHRIFYRKNANYSEKDLMQAKLALNSRFYFLRYIKVIINKYITCWTNVSYLRSLLSILVFSVSPTFGQWLKRKIRTHT